MDVLDAIQTKRAVREFQEKPVPEEVIREILDAGRMAQSSHNTQPWRYIVIRDRETLKALSECGQYAWHLAGAAFGVALVAEGEDEFDMGQTAAYLQLAGWDRGVGSCIASMWEPAKAKAILGIPESKIFHTAISFGYPAEPHPQKKIQGRLPLDEVVRWERW